MLYQVHHLKDTSRPGSAGLVQQCHGEIRKDLARSSATLYGVFPALFGLASNELYLVTYAEDAINLSLPTGIEELSTHNLEPTVRPQTHAPRQTPGVYVFRWFSVANRSIEEIARLSGEAWPTFEGSFETEVQGLFREQGAAEGNPDDTSTMLLITWYRDLSVWEVSRHPPQEARDNFIRRHQLTLSATPIATTLMPADSKPNLVSQT